MTANKLPSSIKLLGRTINIIYSNKIPAGDRITDEEYDEQLYGKTFPLDTTIYINNTINQEVQRSTLLHELIHFISDYLHLNLKESQVCGLESALYSTLKEVQYND